MFIGLFFLLLAIGVGFSFLVQRRIGAAITWGGMWAVACIIFLYINMPVMSVGFGGWLWSLCVAGLMLGGINVLNIPREDSQRTPGEMICLAVGGGSTLGMLLLLVISFFISSEMMNARAYADKLGEVERRELGADLAPINPSQMRLVPTETSGTKVARTLGADPGLGSRLNVGTGTSVRLNGCFKALMLGGKVSELCFENELVVISPLDHNGFFVWWNNGTTPGYTITSSTNPDKFYIVTGLVDDEGKTSPIGLRYTEGAYFSANIWRWAYTHNPSIGLTDVSFEVDDSGKPWFVITTFENTIGWRGPEATGVLLINPETGEITQYGLAEVPEWIDRVQPADFIGAQLTWWGAYSTGGWWNANFGAKTGVQKPTEGHATVEGTDGQLYYYTGMASTGNDQSTSGFFLVNYRTKEARYYNYEGAAEMAAMASAENAPEMARTDYKAAFPILYAVDGVPTYFMPMQDAGNLTKAFVFVNVRQPEILGTGDTFQAALKAYRTQLRARNQGAAAAEGVAQETTTYQGTITDVVVLWNGEGNTFYFRLGNHPGVEFAATEELSQALKWLKAGDLVNFEAFSGQEETIVVNAITVPASLP